ncbi:MAG: hypothetical protein R3D67_16970 [Hyphomicrobiaceae bacterium]
MIYENSDTLPRVLFAREAQAADFEEIVKTGYWPAFDPRSTVLLHRADGAAINRLPGEARLVTYGQNRIEIDAISASGGWVVLNDVWHPWWFAEVDGKPVAIEQANVLFRAVQVSGGRHRITMTFEPLRGVLASLRTWRKRQR